MKGFSEKDHMKQPIVRGADVNKAASDDVFGAMLAAHAQGLTGYARRLTGRGADADDLVQDTMLRCWTARQTFRAGTNFTGWTRTVMRNVFLTGRRRARFQAELPEEALARLLRVEPDQEGAVELRDVLLAMHELSPEHRQAVLLASEGVSTIDAATRLSISTGAFKSRVLRGRDRLRSLTDDRVTRLSSVNRMSITPAPFVRKPRDWKGVVIG
jgi:RNA polymerase sigma factor (sigma-70 family)